MDQVMYVQQVGNGIYLGDTLVDQDPREKGKREGQVVGFKSESKKKATKHFCEVKWGTGRKTWVGVDRCHEDPSRKTGYLVKLTSPWRKKDELNMAEFANTFPQFLNGNVIPQA